MTTDTTDTLNTFTEQTWAGLEGSMGLTRQSAPNGWMRLHDLAVEAHRASVDFCELSFQEMNTLVAAAANGLPVTITHRVRIRSGYDGWQNQVTTRTYIVKQFMGYGGGTTSNLYVRSWGFAHPLALSDLVSVSAPESTYEFEEV